MGALYAKGRITHHHVSADGRELLVTSHPNASFKPPQMPSLHGRCEHPVCQKGWIFQSSCVCRGGCSTPNQCFFNAAHACLPGSVQALRAKGPITTPFQMGVTCAPKPPRFFPAAHVPHIAACGRFVCRKIWVVRSSLLCKQQGLRPMTPCFVVAMRVCLPSSNICTRHRPNLPPLLL